MKGISDANYRLTLIRNIFVAIIFLATFVFIEVIDPSTPLKEQILNPSYSTYNLQVDALLKGQLQLVSSLKDMQHDWVWHNGGHITWGLGIPLIRLPFDVVGKLIGWSCFPDRLVWFILFVGFFLAVRRIFSKLNYEVDTVFGLTILASFFIPLYWLTFTRNEPYEQAVYYLGYLSSLVIFLNLLYRERPTLKIWSSIFLLSGFLCMIRPTGFLTGVSIVAVRTCFEISKPQKKRLLLGYALFAIGIVIQLWLNKLRFGDWFEFGHRLTFSGNPIVDYLNKFEDPFANEPFWSAGKELFATLFFRPDYNDFNFFEASLSIWQSTTMRFREIYTPVYNLISLGILLGGWSLVFRNDRHTQTYRFLGLFSIFQFFLMSALYIRSPIGSRYLVDYAPAFLSAYVSVFLYLTSRISPYLNSYGKNSIGFVLSLILLISFFLPVPPNKRPSMTSQELTAPLDLSYLHLKNSDKFEPNNTYTCAVKPKPKSKPKEKTVISESNYWLDKIRYNGTGWDHLYTCDAMPLVSLYLRVSKCISMELITDNQSFIADPELPMVKAGLRKLAVVDKVVVGRSVNLKFCSPPSEESSSEISPVFIGFVHAKDLFKKTDIALVKISSDE